MITVTVRRITLATQMLWQTDGWQSPSPCAFADVTRGAMRCGRARRRVGRRVRYGTRRKPPHALEPSAVRELRLAGGGRRNRLFR